jgi:hypothetical protein
VIDSDAEQPEFAEPSSEEIEDHVTCQDVTESISTESDDDTVVPLTQPRVRRNNHDVNALRDKLRNKYLAKKQAEQYEHVSDAPIEHVISDQPRDSHVCGTSRTWRS